MSEPEKKSVGEEGAAGEATAEEKRESSAGASADHEDDDKRASASSKKSSGAGGGEGDHHKEKEDSQKKSTAAASAHPPPPGPGHPEKKRRDGTRNKMSFDVDELEEGLYIEVEDEEDVEEYVEYEEVPDEDTGQEGGGGGGDGAKRGSGKEDKRPGEAASTMDDSAGYKIRPDLSQKFRPGTVQVIIEKAIKEHLEGKEFLAEECEEWTRQILADVHEKVKSQNYKRYKIITQITLGERRGEGAASATRSLWDAEADCMATYTFLNDSMFCNGTVYGIYFY